MVTALQAKHPIPLPRGFEGCCPFWLNRRVAEIDRLDSLLCARIRARLWWPSCCGNATSRGSWWLRPVSGKAPLPLNMRKRSSPSTTCSGSTAQVLAFCETSMRAASSRASSRSTASLFSPCSRMCLRLIPCAPSCSALFSMTCSNEDARCLSPVPRPPMCSPIRSTACS